MFDNNKIDKDIYSENMSSLKKMNAEYISLKNSKAYRRGRELTLLYESLKRLDLKRLSKLILKKIRLNKASLYTIIRRKERFNQDESNYFSRDKFVVYTCIIGDYDRIFDPVTEPDNCDFYLITDIKRNIDIKIWREIVIEKNEYGLETCSNVEINRYFKMHPEVLFGEYKYSVYVDGNIKIISDLTEYINKIPEVGIALHSHGKRDCTYEEATSIILLGKAHKENIKNHVKKLREMNFPERYGLLDCSVIAREHNNAICKSLMNMWWIDFLTLSRRDQMSFPAVLYRHNIPVHEIAVLGVGIENDYAVRVEGHK